MVKPQKETDRRALKLLSIGTGFKHLVLELD
jgi:hypothetical protein